MRHIKVLATPNPNVFPVLLALDRKPGLAIELLPVADGTELQRGLDAGADALAVMTPTAAALATRLDLILEGVYFWRGFWIMSEASAPQNWSDKGLLVTAPTSSAAGGMPDWFTRAALRRAGYGAVDLDICFLPVKQGIALAQSGAPMSSDRFCDPAQDQPPQGLVLVEPAASGLELMARLPFSRGRRLVKRLDMQKLFTGFTAWPEDELPLGGIAVRRAVLSDPLLRNSWDEFVVAYRAAVDDLYRARTDTLLRWRLARAISAGINRYYGGMGMDLPSLAVMESLERADLRFEVRAPGPQWRSDLTRWLTEITPFAPPAQFIPIVPISR